MATHQSINLLLDCIICGRKRAKHDPRVLACKHGFCQTCLLDSNILYTEGHIQCPVCWQKTLLNQEGIRGLPVDDKVIEADEAFHITSLLQSCDPCAYKGVKKVACAHCANCEFKLCKECVEVHQKKDKLANHVILKDLCEIHLRDFTHACLTCYTGLCYGCIISEFHFDHDVCEMTDARDKASGLMAERQVMLQGEIQDMDEMINSTLDGTLKKLSEQRKQTEEKLNDYKTKLLDSIMAALDKRDQDFHKSATESLEQQNEASSQASNCLNEMRMIKEEGQGKLNILNTIVKKSVHMFSAVKGIRTSKDMKVNGPELADDICETSEGITKGVFEIKVQLGNLCHKANSKPREELVVRKLSDGKGFSQLYSVQALPDGSALLSDHTKTSAVKVNIKGEEICRYDSADGKQVRAVVTHNNHVYIASSSGNSISVVSGEKTRSIQLKSKRGYISGLVVEEDHILVVDQRRCLIKYSLEGELMKELAFGRFYSVTPSECPGAGKVYLVSDVATNQMLVSHSDGSMVRTFGKTGKDDGQFSAIRESVVLPNGNILVTDFKLHRISEFKADGTFLGYLLTEEDGLKKPVGLSISHPYLWIACCHEARLYHLA